MGPDPSLRVVTLDTNAINKDYTQNLDAQIAGKTICISDLVLAENVNSPNFAKWTLPNLERLYPHAKRVWLVHSMQHYMEKELETGKPTTCCQTNDYMTQRFRSLIVDAFKAPREAKRRLQALSNYVIPNMLERAAMFKVGTAHLDEMVVDIKAKVPEERMQEIADDATLLPAMMMDCNFRKTAVQTLSELPHRSVFDPEVMMHAGSIWVRFCYAKIAHSIWAFRQKPFSDRRAKDVLGDHNDEDVAIVGSFTNELLTDDPLPRYIDTALRACLDVLHGKSML